MSSETNEKKENAACCDPKEFQGMFEMMEKYCAGKTVTLDCSTIIEAVKKGCSCGPATEETKKESCCS